MTVITEYGGFPDGSDGKESTCNAGDLESIPVWEDPLDEGNGNPLQYSCLENSMDRGLKFFFISIQIVKLFVLAL